MSDEQQDQAPAEPSAAPLADDDDFEGPPAHPAGPADAGDEPAPEGEGA